MARKKADQTEQEERAERLASVTDQYPDEFLLCRDMGHSWKPSSAQWLEDGNVERSLECTRCLTIRRQILDKQGYILLGYYYYADGYAIAGIGRLNVDSKASLRKASLDRIMA